MIGQGSVKPALVPKAKTHARAGKTAVKFASAQGGLTSEDPQKTAPSPPDKTTRERVTSKRLQGTLVRWRGVTGFIKLEQDIDHPAFQKHKRQIYLHVADVQNGHEMQRGATVSFLIYADADGLGAEHTMLVSAVSSAAKQPTLTPTAKVSAKKQLIASPTPKMAVKKTNVKVKPEPKTKAVAKQGGTFKLMTVPKSQVNGGLKRDNVDDEDVAGGPELSRSRVTEESVMGEVVSWKGKYGFVKALTDISHAKAGDRGGKIYLHSKDVLGDAKLKVGQSVTFQVYEDSSGLGAEECSAD